MALSSQQLNQLVEVLVERGGLATTSQLDRAVADLMKKTNQRQAKSSMSLSTIIRGLRIAAGQPALNPESAQQDTAYLHATCQRALTTESTPGSYLVPTIS